MTVTNPLPDAPRFLVDYFIGDTVRVQVKRGAFVQSTSPRVMAVVMDITQEGAENVALTLS